MTRNTDNLTLVVDNGKVVKGSGPVCSVKMSETHDRFEDFVTIGKSEDGDFIMLHNANAETLGVAMGMVSAAFYNMFEMLDPKQQEEIRGKLSYDNYAGRA